MSNINVRGIAALSMLQVVDNKKSLTGVLAYQSPKVADEDRGLLQNLCFGSSRYFFSINALSKILLQKPLPEEARPVQALLWVGLYQLAHSSISEHAAIHETVEACTQLKLEKYKGVLNAILRRFQREKDTLLKGLSDSDVTLFNHPKWYLKLVKKSWPDQWQSICDQGNLQAPMCLRVNTHYVDREKYLLTLNDDEIKASKGVLAPTSVYLNSPCDVFSLPQFGEGSCSVQDEAAQLAAQILDPQPGDLILDACSAPGGKTCHILEASNNQAIVTAIDADEMRLVRVHENLARLKLSAKVKQGEAQNPDTWWDGNAFDRILLDVPCSATGVIRRHPDIKLLRQKADIDNLAELQQEILQKTWTMLKPGGTLLYSTCSIFPIENSLNIEKFLTLEKTASVKKLDLSTGVDTGFGTQLFPEANSHDGFFYALLTKSQ
jgi:16S rRNA (cytosine967-C5)-methyltransferase